MADTETLSTLLDLLFVPAVIFIVLTVHEWGHYAAARFFNIGVESFSLGYGRDFWSFRDKRGTRWYIRMWPIMGHVKLADNHKAKGVPFSKAPLWQRIITVIAGPAVNIIFAFLVLSAFFAIFGQPSKQPVFGGVEPGQPAYEAGMRTDDRIIAINGKPVRRYMDVRKYTYPLPAQELRFTVERGAQVFDVLITPAVAEYVDADGIERKHGRIGVLIGHVMLGFGAMDSVGGVDVRGDIDKAREMIAARLGQKVTVSVKSSDDMIHDYETVLNPDMNAHLLDASHPHYDSVYLGNVKSHFYLERNVTRSLMESGKQIGEMITTMAGLPFQLFPMDRQAIRPDTLVKDDGRFALRKFYGFVYRLALVSVFIGLLNLIPFPGLDGGLLLRLSIEGFMGADHPMLQDTYKYLLLGAIAMLYAFVFMYNIHDFPRYLERKAQKITESHHWPFAIEDRKETR